jgi:hypothetical protein
VIAGYRVILFTDGKERLKENERTGNVEVARRGVTESEAETVRASGGKLCRTEMLRHRVRHFVDGTAIGSRAFLEELFRACPERFGPRRKSGARKIRGCETPLCALRDLRDRADGNRVEAPTDDG